jgi:hypothetical protein
MITDLLFFVIDVGENDYSRFTLPFIRKYCKKYNYKLFVLKERIDQHVHPSWYKLLCHKICKAQFIVCCDLDIFIMPSAPPIHKEIQENVLNICEDALAPHTHLIKKFPFFKYNCGLMGIPKTSQTFMEKIYDSYAVTGTWPCWEQMYVNQAIINKPLNILNNKWNCMIYLYDEAKNPSYNSCHFKHLTTYAKYKEEDRLKWSKEHYYFFLERICRTLI